MRPAFLPAETTMVTGSAARGCGGQPQYRMPPAFRLLREAAEAAAIIWSGPLYPQARERAQRQLRRALGDLRAVSTELAAADRRPELHAFSHCLDQARRYADAMLSTGDRERDGVRGEHGDVVRATARHVISVRKQPTPAPRTPDAGIAELPGRVRALADVTGELAGDADEPSAPQLSRIHGYLDTAVGHLRAVLPPQLQPPPAGTAASDLPRCSE